MLPVMLKRLSINISKYFFLLLFLGFFGSTTFFNHSHIVNGITIVHSHPYKSAKNGVAEHSHSGSGFLLVHFLSNIIATVSFALISFAILLILKEKLSTIFNNSSLCKPLYNSNLLRGPPMGMLYQIF